MCKRDANRDANKSLCPWRLEVGALAPVKQLPHCLLPAFQCCWENVGLSQEHHYNI